MGERTSTIGGNWNLHAQTTDIINTAKDNLMAEAPRRRLPKRIVGVLGFLILGLAIYAIYVTALLKKARHEDIGREVSRQPSAVRQDAEQTNGAEELPAAANKLIVMGTLTPGVIHEVNNYVNNIALTADLLLEDYSDLSDEERLDMVADIVKEAEKINIVAQSLSSFAGETEPDPQLCEIPGIIDDVMRLAGKHIKRSKVKVNGELAPNLPRVRCIRWKIEHAFLNIILNAIEAMPAGGTITIACGVVPKKDFVSVEFTDTGSGLPEGIVSEVFERAFTTRSRISSLGFGLPVARKIIKEHDGDIQVTSQAGKGATVTVLLPVCQSS